MAGEAEFGFAGMKFLNAALFAAALGATALLCANPGHDALFWTLVVVSLVLGITLVLPIGGADMPVVIALLNSYSGIAAATSGFITITVAAHSRGVAHSVAELWRLGSRRSGHLGNVGSS